MGFLGGSWLWRYLTYGCEIPSVLAEGYGGEFLFEGFEEGGCFFADAVWGIAG